VVRHICAITFQLAEVDVTGPMVRAILAAIGHRHAPDCDPGSNSTKAERQLLPPR
jgi:hypothetical protein